MKPELVLDGDQAYTPKEWAAEQRRREQKRVYRKGYQQRNRERIAAQKLEWVKRNREHVRTYSREWMRAKRARDRAGDPLVWAWLHSPACQYGPHRNRRRGCKPIPVVAP